MRLNRKRTSIRATAFAACACATACVGNVPIDSDSSAVKGDGGRVGNVQIVVDVPTAFAAANLTKLVYSVLSKSTGKAILSGEIMAPEAPSIVGTTVSLAAGEQDVITLAASTSDVTCFANSVPFSALAAQTTRVNMTVQCVDYPPGPASSSPPLNGMIVDAGLP
jgi:hypothetical protein